MSDSTLASSPPVSKAGSRSTRERTHRTKEGGPGQSGRGHFSPYAIIRLAGPRHTINGQTIHDRKSTNDAPESRLADLTVTLVTAPRGVPPYQYRERPKSAQRILTGSPYGVYRLRMCLRPSSNWHVTIQYMQLQRAAGLPVSIVGSGQGSRKR